MYLVLQILISFYFLFKKTLPTKPHVHACPIDGFVMAKGSNIGTKP